MVGFLGKHPQSGLIGAITVGEDGKVNFPCLKFKSGKESVIKTKRSLSFAVRCFQGSFCRNITLWSLIIPKTGTIHLCPKKL
jgi:hypothetical protein